LEGRKEGREKGREENIREVILRAYNNNISIPTIATLTQLSEKKVKQVLTEKGLLERS
jgi:predicted transposase/invertase (TIGR01784 family)